jgi:hypothetical protein
MNWSPIGASGKPGGRCWSFFSTRIRGCGRDCQSCQLGPEIVMGIRSVFEVLVNFFEKFDQFFGPSQFF